MSGAPLWFMGSCPVFPDNSCYWSMNPSHSIHRIRRGAACLARPSRTGALQLCVISALPSRFQSSPAQVGRALVGNFDLAPPDNEFQSSPAQVGRALAWGLNLQHCNHMFQSSPAQVGRALLSALCHHPSNQRFNPRPPK